MLYNCRQRNCFDLPDLISAVKCVAARFQSYEYSLSETVALSAVVQVLNVLHNRLFTFAEIYLNVKSCFINL